MVKVYKSVIEDIQRAEEAEAAVAGRPEKARESAASRRQPPPSSSVSRAVRLGSSPRLCVYIDGTRRARLSFSVSLQSLSLSFYLHIPTCVYLCMCIRKSVDIYV